AILAAAPGIAGSTIGFAGMRVDTMTLLCLLLFVGAMGKSAQLPLHTWLPDAMEGPTPVSALIHAATMVTAGVFMVCRLSPMFETSATAQAAVTYVGAATAIFAATVATTQNDIKRVVAYSTCSQLGYMFFAAGVGAYGASMFHLFTHAFFKALLFLGAGSVIHAMHHEQDMRYYGALRKEIPFTFWVMVIGTVAITGVGLGPIGFAGFWTKDAILEASWASGSVPGTIAFWLGAIAALMTSFYSWRLIHLTFFGQPPRIETGHQRGDRAEPESDRPGHRAARPRRLEDGVLGPEAGKADRTQANAGDRHRADHHHPEGERDLLPQGPVVPHVLLVVHGVDHAARAEEQQGLEEGVREQME